MKVKLSDIIDAHEYAIMENFIYSLDEPVKSNLESAIRGRDAFRRFKNTIRQFGIEDLWYEYRAEKTAGIISCGFYFIILFTFYFLSTSE